MNPIALAQGWNATVLAPWPADDAAGIRTDGMRRYPAVEEWRSFLQRLVQAPETLPGYTVLKYSPGGQVIRAMVPAHQTPWEVICKSSRERGTISRWLRRWQGSRERRHCNRALGLLRAGVNTAQPLAVVEHGRPPDAAWQVTEYVAGLVDLDQICLRELPLLERQRQRALKPMITAAVVELLVRLERAGLSHRDLKASNILASNWLEPRQGLRVWVLDLEGVYRPPMLTRRRREKSLIRLAASLRSYKSITRADYARFLRQYLRSSTGHIAGWRAAYRRLGQAAARYAHHAQRRKRHKLDGYNADL